MDKIYTFLDKVWKDYILTNKIMLISLAAFFLFQKLIEDLINDVLVKPVLSKVECGWKTDAIFYLVIIIIIIALILKIYRRYTYSKKYIIAHSLSFVFCIYYYNIQDNWDYTTFESIHKLPLLVIIPFYSILSIAGFLVLKLFKDKPTKGEEEKEEEGKEKEGKEKGFLYDEPNDGEKKKDTFNRDGLAKKIATRIIHTRSNDSSFAIGICSEWGAGKTSFINLITGHIEAKKKNEKLNLVVIKFNPWLNYSTNSIVKDFFSTISSALKPYHSNLAVDLQKYSDVLVEAGNSNVNSIIKPIQKLFNKTKSVKEEFESINNIIKETKLQLIIIIDDLDRLYKNEIHEIIRLIRNTANFGNTVFICAYDKAYLSKALEDINEYNHRRFLEKIFQLEILLPKIETNRIIEFIVEKMKEILIYDDICEFIKNLYYDDQKSFKTYESIYKSIEKFQTIRGAKIFLNSFMLTYNKELKGAILYRDLFHLEILKYRYQEIYKLLFLEKEIFINQKAKGKPFTLNDNCKSWEFPNKALANYKEESKEIIEILERVFFDSPSTEDNKRNHLSAKYHSYFERYSFYRLLENDFPETEFSNARNSSKSEFFEKIDELINKGFVRELKKKLESINDYDHTGDYKIIIEGIFHFATSAYKDSIIGFNYYDLLYKLNNEIWISNIPDFKEYIEFLLKEAKSPYTFHSNLLFTLEKNKIDFSNLYNNLPKQNYRLFYLEKYLSETKRFDGNYQRLLYNCNNYRSLFEEDKTSKNTENYVIEPNKDAYKITRKYIQYDLHNFLTLHTVKDPQTSRMHLIHNSIYSYFEDEKDFFNYLKNVDAEQYPFIEEYIKFFIELRNNNFKPISFSFKYPFPALSMNEKTIPQS